LSADGFEYLGSLSSDNLDDLIGKAIRTATSSLEEITIFDRTFLENVEEVGRREREPSLHRPASLGVTPMAKTNDADIKILEQPPIDPQGDLQGFVNYFRSRFRKIERIMRNRIDMRDTVSIGSVESLPLKAKVKVIGIVTGRRTSGERLFLELEDEEASVTVMAGSETAVKGLSVLEDQVICVEAVKYKQDLLVANDFIWPDIPMKPSNRSEVPLCAAFIADVHVGSVHFREDLFRKFLRWLNMEVGPNQSKLLASRVKYLVISGDLVDGIGIYPNQMDELNITDIHEQYSEAARLLSEIPDYVEIIVLPGNHDAVRISLPQPPIPREYAEELFEDRRIHLLANPSRLKLHGVEVCLSHGKALDEILSKVPGLDFHNPVKGMELLLRCRHVAPTYGSSTPIAPEREDGLIISSVPDILHMGHIHVQGIKKYKGTTLISSGGWQDQTPFQKRVDLTPTVGVATIVDLQSHATVPLDFKEFN